MRSNQVSTPAGLTVESDDLKRRRMASPLASPVRFRVKISISAVALLG